MRGQIAGSDERGGQRWTRCLGAVDDGQNGFDGHGLFLCLFSRLWRKYRPDGGAFKACCRGGPAIRGRRLNGYKFRRQHPVGPYILDFACLERHVAIEADGGQHADNRADRRRTAWLKARGWRVLRLWNNDILANTEGVVGIILRTLEAAASEKPSKPSPSRAPGARVPPSPAIAGEGH
ncbi:MAG: endonuclease domain-containing protein [Rhodospirillales bacterium]|nr:endonuclease domain-containing protein [Rhodospirillales bacterium]